MQYTFVGTKNYMNAFLSDVIFPIQLPITLQTVALQMPLILVFSMFLALLLNSKFKGRTIVRGIFFLPVIIASGVIINILTTETLATNMMSGQRASMLFEGIEFQKVLVSLGLPIPVIETIMKVVNGIFELIWKSGVQIVLLLAGLQSVPQSVYEAADIEGATAWERFWKVTVPIVSPQIILCIFYTIIDTSTDYSNLVIRYIRRLADTQNFEMSATIACIWFFIVMAFVGLVFLLIRKHIYYMDDRG